MASSDFLFGPAPHQEAIDFIKSKPVVAREVFDGLLPDLKARAFTITGLEGQANVAQAIRDRIADLPAGHDWDAIKKDIVNDISPFIVDPNASPEEHDAQVVAANRRAEILLRTHGFQAYQAAQFQVMDRQKDVMPYWQYVTMEDERVRPTHAALDQIVLPADSPFWNNHFPPWDWGCRCQAVAISQWTRDDLAKADEKRAPDDKLVMEGPVEQALLNGTLVRPGRTFDVRSPREKEGGSGFGWDPRTLKMPLDELKARYDAATWSEFEAWAKQTPLGPDQPTVWEWLAGTDGGNQPIRPKPAPISQPPKPVIPPPPHHAPPPLPRPTLDQFIAQHTTLPGKMTEAEAKNVIAALKQPHGITVADKVTRISVAKVIPPGWPAYVRGVTQRFIDVIPKYVLDVLPQFEIRVLPKMADSALGQYDPTKKLLSLNEGKLAGDAQKIEEVIFHELAHWVHLHAPAAYQAAVLAHFNARTAGQSTAQLPNYGPGTHGKKDKFWDTYMGREYAGIIDGCEIPTKTFELLCNPLYLSKLWNELLHRETIKIALSILFS
jgi:SPP1 gp7 family putative phage head morphogenesis protein